MPQPVLQPPLTAPDRLNATLSEQGFAVLDAASVCAMAGIALGKLQALQASWNALPPDQFLKDGGRYRRRRHASFELIDQQVKQVPHRAHWQPLSYNALHGGMQRWFEPMDSAVLQQDAWQKLLSWLARVASAAQGEQTWFAEAHQFRIDTTDGIGRPTPEGAHRDGVNWVAVFLIGRHGIKGGETRVFDMDSPHGQRFTLIEPWSLLLLDDARVIHETTPIQPETAGGWRDTLVITLRSGGFLDEPELIAPQAAV
ncbi:MAG: 2OG-Fe dioxygenase family protein [Limnohabitans sp.]|uniref:2OG-Fe dioxygenase family protein n=1 Tax=Limnohabitans sp. TaxID=1907725 RepID=UPI0025E009B4|nr:2OG-Fe dioxygenase family protein [Limnohabitans sp.]MCO4088979.1 2OG-Fe dioxygenase family protein [Limnohabitans sp.]